MTRERRVGVELADDLPTYTGHSGKFMLKLIAAWIAMGFRRPEITLGPCESILDVFCEDFVMPERE
ncbi:MAG TPA: hypothetical protein VN879_22785 [Candidatus Acidoferrales bacterium]|nr:hypothetical protein [Candidatus Acidoferrales bacterium]